MRVSARTGLGWYLLPPINNLERRRNKREGKGKWRLIFGGDVICHLQLMTAAMTCMSAAHVRHLLPLRDGEAWLREGPWAGVEVPRLASWAGIIIHLPPPASEERAPTTWILLIYYLVYTKFTYIRSHPLN